MQNISVIISMYNIIMVTLNSLFIVKKGIKWIEIIGLRIRYLFNLFQIFFFRLILNLVLFYAFLKSEFKVTNGVLIRFTVEHYCSVGYYIHLLKIHYIEISKQANT